MRSLAKTCKAGRPHSVPLQKLLAETNWKLFNWFSIVPFAEQRAQSNARCWRAVRSACCPILQRYLHATNNPIQHRKRKQGPSKCMKERKFISLKNIRVRQYSLQLPTETILYQAIWDSWKNWWLTLVKLWIVFGTLWQIVKQHCASGRSFFLGVLCQSVGFYG